MGQGGGTPPSDYTTTYPRSLLYQHAAVLNGLQPLADEATPAEGATWANIDLTMNVHQSMIDASRAVGGSPYELAEAYDPDDDLDAIQTRYDTFDAVVAGLSPLTDFAAVVAAATSQYDSTFTPSTQIDDVVDAAEARQRAEHLRNIARISASFFDARAVMGTQFDQALVMAEHFRELNTADLDARLRLQNQQVRSEGILRMCDHAFRQIQQQLEAERISTALLNDLRSNRITASQNAVAFNIMVEEKDSNWDLDHYAYEAETLSSLFGAAVVPRGISGREQMLAALLNSASAGVQFGMAAGSPGLGVLSGLGIFAANLWGLGGR